MSTKHIWFLIETEGPVPSCSLSSSKKFFSFNNFPLKCNFCSVSGTFEDKIKSFHSTQCQ